MRLVCRLSHSQTLLWMRSEGMNASWSHCTTGSAATGKITYGQHFAAAADTEMITLRLTVPLMYIVHKAPEIQTASQTCTVEVQDISLEQLFAGTPSKA